MSSMGFSPVFYNLICQELTERINDCLHAIGSSVAIDFPDYKFRCGQIAALREALDIAEGVRQKILES